MPYIAVSLLLHAILFLFLINQNPKQKKSDPTLTLSLLDPPPEPLPEAPKKTIQKKIKQKPKGKVGKKPGSSKKPLSSLMPQSFSMPSPKKQGGNFNHGRADRSVPDNSSAPWGEGGGEFGRLSDYGNLEKVAFTIDKMVEFPHQLAYRKMGGVVQSRLVVDEKGECDWKKSFFNGNNPYLRVYVLSVLKQFCRGNFWHGLKKRKSSNVDFSFHFDTYSDETSDPIVNGNVVLVRLPGYQQRGSWRLGPIQGNFLFPNALFLNPTWIVENWNSIVHDEDPLERFKEPEK